MQVSRRELYALGEPLGNSCTEKKPGGRGRVYGGGGGGSSSSSTNQTFNTDKRLITGEGSIGLSLDDSLSLMNFEDNDTTSLTDSRSFSSSTSSADTNNSGNTTTINTLDGGAIAGAMNTITQAVNDAFNFSTTSSNNALGFGERALQTVELNNANLGEGFTRLLDAADNLFERGEKLVGLSGDRIADAYRTATVEKSGSIDNKTITVMVVAGAVALIALNARK
jgi:hypothetical protein